MINGLFGAIIFAIWSVTLFYGKKIGLSMMLFTIPLTIFIIKILEKRHEDIDKKAKLLIIPISLLASTYFLFENIIFNTLNIIAIPTLIAIMILMLFKEKFDINFRTIKKVLKVLVLPLIYIGDTFSRLKNNLKNNNVEKLHKNKSDKIKKIIKAFLITMPLVVFVIALLSAADADFARIFSKMYTTIIKFLNNLSLSELVERLILLTVAFVYFISFFNYISNIYKCEIQKETNKQKDSFTIKVVLGALNAIYIIFCYLQIKSLIINNTNINYAYYARRGFFQLMIVSIINLITLLVAKNREQKEDKKGTKYIKTMSLAMVIFTFIILISAAVRMNAYENAYGYTISRLLVYCILFTEAILLIPTIIYILDKNIDLPKIYFTIVLTIYLGMNFINFDKVIAKRNVDRFFETGKIDMTYIQNNLGTGSASQVIRIIDKNQEAQTFLQNMYNILEKEKMDFRDVNISKIMAKNTLKSIRQHNTDKNEEKNTYNNYSNNTINTNIYSSNNSNATKNNNYNNTFNNNNSQSVLIGRSEEFFGIVKSKNENTIEISYTSYVYDTTLWKVNVSESDIHRIDVGDWVRGKGIISDVFYKLKTINAETISVTSRQIYNDNLLKALYNKNKIWSSVSYKYESEGKGDGYIICPIYLADNGEQIDGYIKIFFDEETKSYLGRATNPVKRNYSIPENEMVEITFKNPIRNLVDIKAQTFEFIAD